MRILSPSVTGENNVQSFQAIQKCLSSLSRTNLSFVLLTVQWSENYSSLSLALRGHKKAGGWRHAWQNIDSLLIKPQLLLCLTLYQFRRSLFLLLQSFLSPVHSLNFSLRQEGWLRSYLWGAESTPSLLTLDGPLIVPPKLSHSVSEQTTPSDWAFLQQTMSDSETFNSPKRCHCKSVDYLLVNKSV